VKLVGKTAACSHAPCSTTPRFSSGAIPVRFTIFSRLRARCHQFFRLFEWGASVRNAGLKVPSDQRSRSNRVRKAYAKGERAAANPGFTIFSRRRPCFSRLGSLRRREFHPRLTRAILPLVNRGETR
jgi:hypothetical protein